MEHTIWFIILFALWRLAIWGDRRRKERNKKYKPHAKVCEQCGNPFMGTNVQRFCCHQCFTTSTATLKSRRCVCVVCHSVFTPRKADQECCSGACAAKLRAIRRDGSAFSEQRASVDYSAGRMLSKALHRNGDSRYFRAVFGYSEQEWRDHVSANWSKGMSMANRKQWHIDHSRPKVTFEYESRTDPAFRECWSLDNLRPMWAKDNLRKHTDWHTLGWG